MADFRLEIANFSIDIINNSSCPISFEKGYTSFLSSDRSLDATIKINVFSGISQQLREPERPVYAADFDENRLWQISQFKDGLRFHVFSPTAPFQLQQVAELNEELTEWSIYSERIGDGEDRKLFPLLYPMGPLIMYYLTVKFDAIMIHGSGVSDSGSGRVFTGVSGQGKTTMAKLWFDAGAEILNDDRLIIRKDHDGYTVHNTPMFYVDVPRSSKLESIYSIYHLDCNQFKMLSGSEAVL